MRLAWPGPAGDGRGEGWPSGGITRLLRSADSPEEIIVATHETGHVRLCPFDGRSPFLRAANERWDKRHPDQRRYLWGTPCDFSFHPDMSNFEASRGYARRVCIYNCFPSIGKYVEIRSIRWSKLLLTYYTFNVFLFFIRKKKFSYSVKQLFSLDWKILEKQEFE